jgi:DNA polymerase III epsilon subunit-like protein
MSAEFAIIFDTETTGLTLHPSAGLALQPRMIEFGAVLMSLADGSVFEECNILINPGAPLPPEIVKITGITDDDLREAATFVDVLPQLRRIFGEAAAVVAHNLPFDRAILRGELLRAKPESFPWPSRETCTVGLYRAEWGHNPRLGELYEAIIGHPPKHAHRALGDVRTMVEIIQKEELWRVF